MTAEIPFSGTEPLLSVIYAGPNRFSQAGAHWRSSLVLNKLAENVDALGMTGGVEIIVADWGGETPLGQALELTQTSKALIKFFHIPPHVSAICDQGRGFSRAHALNSAARRSSGKYLLLCDDDVYLPLETTAELLWHLRRGYFHSYGLGNSFFWASADLIPNDLFTGTPELKNLPTMPLDPALGISTTFPFKLPVQETLDEHIRRHSGTIAHRAISTEKAYGGAGAALLISRGMWLESRGFDEKVIGVKWDDRDISRRLLRKYRWDDLAHHGLKFFLLGLWPDGCHPSHAPDSPAPSKPPGDPAAVFNNAEDWGLAQHELVFTDGFGWALNPASGGSEAQRWSQFDPAAAPRTVREIVAGNPLYRDVSERFQYLPLTWFGNHGPLHALMNALQPHTVCEIGSYMGASTRFIAEFPSVVRVFCIDHWDRNRVEGYDPAGASQRFFNNLYEQFLANAVHAGIADKILPIRLDSHAAAEYCACNDIRFDLIYVDGDHTTVGAKGDIERWHPLLNTGGVLCGDDWVWQKEPDNVAGAVTAVAREKGWQVFHAGNFWMAMPGAFSVQPLTLEELRKIGRSSSIAFSPGALDLRDPHYGAGSDHLPPAREGICASAVDDTKPLVSIWMVCKDSEAFIHRSLDGILALQGEYPNIELIIQDRVSTDGTLTIIKEYAARFNGKLKLVSEQDDDPDDAFWRALKRCKGEFIACCQSHGQILPNAPALALSAFNKHPQAAAVFGWMISTDENGITLDIDRGPSAFDFEKLICAGIAPHFAASFFRRSCLEAIGIHTREWKYGLREFEIWARLCMRFSMCHIPSAMAKNHRCPTSDSPKSQGLMNSVQGRLALITELIDDEGMPEDSKEIRAGAFAGQHILAAWGYLSAERPLLCKARKEILEALKYQPHPENSLYSLFVEKLYAKGFELCQQNELQQALEYLSLIIETGNHAKNIHLCIALVLVKLGRYAEARMELDKEFAHGGRNSDAVDLLMLIDNKLQNDATRQSDSSEFSGRDRAISCAPN